MTPFWTKVIIRTVLDPKNKGKKDVAYSNYDIAKGGYALKIIVRNILTDIFIIYTVVTRLEIRTLKIEVYKIDPNAFMVMNSVKDTVGGMTKKRRYKHETG